ncbi:glycosyltransferase family 4 protein [Candidatus Woesearchaeota archaeon]|nr:glycosyltransferase family 4 protein [Candidatus Woesearchaeota archaeon]
MRLCFIDGGYHKVYMSTHEMLGKAFDYSVVTGVDENIPGVKTYKLHKYHVLSPSFSMYRGLYSFLKKHDFDALCVRPYYRLYSIAVFWYALVHKKKVFIFEEQRNDPHKFVERMVFGVLLFLLRPLMRKVVAKTICTSEPAYLYLKKNGLPRLEHVPIPYAVKKVQVKEQKKLKIICVARFDWLKAHHVLIDAVELLVKKYGFSDVEVDLFGKGPLEQKYRMMVANKGLEGIVRFKGTIPNEQIDAEYRKHNLFVLSSVSEPFGMVVLEAMSNGLPVIVSDATGAKGSVQGNGYVCKTGDASDLAKKMYAMGDAKKRAKMGKKSLLVLEKVHDPKMIEKKLLHELHLHSISCSDRLY